MTDVSPPEDAEDPKSSPDSVPVNSDQPEVPTEEVSPSKDIVQPPSLDSAEKQVAPADDRPDERRTDWLLAMFSFRSFCALRAWALASSN